MNRISPESNRARSWASEAPTTVDLTQPDQDDWTRRVADEMLEFLPDAEELLRLEESWPDAPILVRLALKLAQSKQRIIALHGDVQVTIVSAVYKEHNRLRTGAEHPHGEDFLVRKVEQIEWLFGEVPGVDWSLLIVDDGCPERSGDIAQGTSRSRSSMPTISMTV